MTNFFLSLMCGLVMGSATVFYVASITKGVSYEKRIKILAFVGVPVGCIMGVVAQLIGTWIGGYMG